MALSREARELLAGITAGIAGGISGGKVGAAAAGNAAIGAIGVQEDRKAEASRAEEERAMRAALQAESSRRFDITTQLSLLDTPGLEPEARQAIAGNVAKMTGMTVDDLKITAGQAIRFSDLISLVTNDEVSESVKAEAWRENAPSFGLDPDAVPWNSMEATFKDLSPDEKQQIFEELRTPGQITDINRVAQFLGNFNGPSKPMTSAQAKMLGLVTESGLTFQQRLDIIRAQRDAQLQMSPKDLMTFIGAWWQRQQILGRSSMSPEEFGAEINNLVQGLGTLQKMLQSNFGPNLNQPAGSRSENSTTPSNTGDDHIHNLNVARRKILNGEFKSSEEVIQALSRVGDTLDDKDMALVKKWLSEASQKQEAKDEVQQ